MFLVAFPAFFNEDKSLLAQANLLNSCPDFAAFDCGSANQSIVFGADEVNTVEYKLLIDVHPLLALGYNDPILHDFMLMTFDIHNCKHLIFRGWQGQRHAFIVDNKLF